MFNKDLKDHILKEANERCKGTLVSTLGIIFTDVGEHFLEAKMNVTPNLH
jgi:acyl-coenzyme A thioesterase PaaI-like protein